MADKKSKKSEQPDPESLLEKRVDEMMDIRGGKGDVSKIDESAGVSDVAASINKSLSEDLKSDKPSEEPEVKETESEPEAEIEESKTAPVLPSAEEPIAEADPEVEPVPEADEPAAEVDATTAEPVPIPDSDIDDSYTEKAVDDIVSEESDKLLAVEDAITKKANKPVVSKTGFGDKLRGLFRHKRFWVLILVLALVLFAVPATRYKILGLVIKKSVTITVIDSKTANPVSSADVDINGTSAKTDANGKAKLSAGLGKRNMSVTKRYYQDLNTTYFVGFKSANTQVKLVATGRLVPITVTNKITGKPLSGAQIQSQGTSAKTNSQGQAEIALPTKASNYTGKVTLTGYNSTDVTITVTDKSVKANTFAVTPAGQVYFLSNASGSLDVVKTNLDGTARKTVLSGTGKEDPKATSLLASRDWRYLVLKAHREGSQASLYLIDTASDKITQFDNSDSDFSLIGWYDHNFVYSLSRNNLVYSQAGKQALKSYDADHLQTNQLDQTSAEGTAGSSLYQNFANFNILNDVVVYSTQWNKEGGQATDATGKNDTIRAVQPNGQGKKDYQSFPTTDGNYIQANLFEPQGIYFAVYNNKTKPTFYLFENQSAKPTNIDQATFDKTYPTFLLSPSGKLTLWTELRDGKNAIFTGDSNAGNKKQSANLSDYSPYGWYSDSYTLVSKNGSELFITPAGGLDVSQQPLKITDYYKPAQTYAGYGYGYGGL